MATLGLTTGLLNAQVPTVPTSYIQPSSAADTSKPGFIWRIHQVSSSQGNSSARTDAQLAGLLGDNIADPSAQGIALAPADAPNPSTAPITFEIGSVINLDRSGGSNGNFEPDDQMPGLPGTGGGSDNAAAEVLTWLDLPAGEITMGVNSDDGFRMTIGGPIPSDQLAAVKVGEFEGGRGADDTIFKFNVPQAGLYAVRVSWENGTGDANFEYFSVASDGTKILVNSDTAGAIKAYRAITAPTRAYVKSVTPLNNAVSVAPNATIKAELVDGGVPIETSTVSLAIDNSPVTATATKAGGVTSISYQPPANFPGGSKHEVALSYTESGKAVTVNWSFTVASFVILSPDLKVTPDTSKPGFLWRIFANQGNTENSISRAEKALAGLLTDSTGATLPNLADANAAGAALSTGTAGSPANLPVSFEISGVINLTYSTAEENGNFVPDQPMPGVPATDGSTDGLAAEIITYLELPAGIITMGVNSDDGFRTYGGNALDAAAGIPLGEFDNLGGRGPADTTFNFEVKEAGVYAFRTVYEQGGSGASLEWFSIKGDGTKVLLNDVANGGLKAYRAITTPVNPFVRVTDPPQVNRQLNQSSSVVTAVLEDGATAINDNSVVLKIDGIVREISKVRLGKELVVTYTPKSLNVPNEQHTAELSYTNTTGSFSRTAQWTFRNLKNIILPAAVITENFDSYDEGSVPTGWTEKNFTRSNNPGLDPTDMDSDFYLGWVVVSRDTAEAAKSRIFDWTEGSQIVNGTAIDSQTLASGNILYAESDSRGGDQVQFLTTKAYNLSAVENPVISFSSLYEQNQDSLGALEYSVDGGVNWLPVVYYLDFQDGGGDIKYNPDGSVDAVTTFTAPNADTAAWTDNGIAKGDKYGDGILAPITAALGPYIAPRWNDNRTEGKRVEVFRLPAAGKKSDVRLRFSQLGTGSWYFGVDNLAFYDVPVDAAAVPPQMTVALVDGAVVLSWTGSGTLQESGSLSSGWAPAASQANPQTIASPSGSKYYRVVQQ